MRARSESFIKNLEEAVIENRKLACPEVDCEDIIVSREFVRSNSSSDIEYWCRNSCCSFHQKRTISLSNANAESDESIDLSGQTSYMKSFKKKSFFSFRSLLFVLPMAFLDMIKQFLD